MDSAHAHPLRRPRRVHHPDLRHPRAGRVRGELFRSRLLGAPDATIGVSGFTIENFEDTALAPGLMISRFGGVVGNFGPTATLPASSVFDPTTDPNTAAGGLQAFVSGVWDGSNVLINHPGPSFSDLPGT